jgi:hypothetical protein
MGSGYLAVSFCVEIYASRVVFGYGFNLLCPCRWCFEFFFPGAPAVFLREGYAGYVTNCRVLVEVPITPFLPSVRGLEFLLFDRCSGALLKSQWGVLGLCALWGIGLLAPAK